MKVPYLESLLKPDSVAPVSIPDDNVRRHTLRQETITNNIIAPASGNGAIILYPNTQSSLIGVSYFENTPGNLTYDQPITVAQQLDETYDYARKSTQVVYVRSATLPAGVYALTGTFNAVTYEGALSEIGVPSYNTLLQSTANPMDKVGNVLVGSGVLALTLPASYDLPYIRLSDRAIASGLAVSRYRDAQNDLVVTPFVNSGSVTSSGGAQNTGVISTTNIDGNIGVQANLIVAGTLTFPTAPAAGAAYRARIQYLGPGGEVIATFLGVPQTLTIALSQRVSSVLNITYPNADLLLDRPIVAVRMGWIVEANALVTTLTFNTEDNFSGILRSYSAATPGVQYPVTIIRYSGVSAGSVISVSGVANYELIPNPELARNVPTSYGRRDPRGMEYIKAVMANRDALGIRSIWTINDYREKMSLLSEIASYNSSESTEAMAFGLKDILNIIRMGLPFADAILPPPITNLVGAGMDAVEHVFGASGKPYAASGMPFAATRRPQRRLNAAIRSMEME